MGMFDIILSVCLLLGFWTGFRRGFILQSIHLAGFIVAYIVAYRYFRNLAPALEAWIPYPFLDQEVGTGFWIQMIDGERLFYSAISFAILFFGTKIVLHLIGHLLTMVASLPGLNFANRWLGGLLGFVGAFFVIFILVHVMMFVPWQTGQNWLSQSSIASWMIGQGDFLSDQFRKSK